MSADSLSAYQLLTFLVLLIIISLIISIIRSIAVAFGGVDLIDDTPENMAVDVVDSLFEVAQPLAAGFSETADQHDATDLLG